MRCQLLAVLLLVALTFSGCAERPAAIPENGTIALQQPNIDKPQEQAKDSITGRMSDLVGQAAESAPSFEDAKKWLSDAGNVTSQTADDTMKWVNEVYQSLSENGMTTAKNAKEWVTEDWNSINAWEYKVVSVNMADLAANPNLFEETLNSSGKLRWDCFHVSESSTTTRFFMKRHKKSYLKNVPLKDMLKLIPLLDAAGG